MSWDYKPKTEEEIKQLALDIHAGKVYTDRHCGNISEISMVFMPLAFGLGLDPEDEKKIGLVYEYMDQAGPRSINGKPTFSSMRFLDTNDTNRVSEKLERIKDVLGDI